MNKLKTNKYKNNYKTENIKQYGRYEIAKSNSVFIKDAFVFSLENTYNDNNFWIPITNLTGEKILGHLKFRKIGEATFVLDDIRQARGSILNLQSLCK
jgi:hypothetical protein